MVLGGFALAFSRLIDNSVVVLENIYRHLELGEEPAVAAEKGGREVALPVLAATLTTVVVFFPGDVPVRRQQVSVLRAGVGCGAFAVCVVRRRDDRGAFVLRALSEGRRIITRPPKKSRSSWSKARSAGPSAQWFNVWFNDRFEAFLMVYDRLVAVTLRRPAFTLAGVRRDVRAQPRRCFRYWDCRFSRARTQANSSLI